jgi:hypothetical protein
MAVTNNAVTVTAGLNCTALTSPPIGSGAITASIGYTDGHVAADSYVSVSATTTPATALHADLVADGYIFVYNPHATLSVTLYVGTSKIGTLQPGFSCVMPIASGSVIGGVVDSAAVLVGVSVIRVTANE